MTHVHNLPSISELGFQEAAHRAGVDPSDLESLCDRYGHGDCYALALVVAERTGWPLRALVQEGDWIHIVTVCPSGSYVDVYGVFPERDGIATRYGVFCEPEWLDVHPDDVECAGWISEDVLQDDLKDARAALEHPWMRLVLQAAGYEPLSVTDMNEETASEPAYR